jgi:prepilin-type N-terminal cleavage/methylation domain-containing protein
MKIEKNVRARKRAGFSLIELLIVIGIIVLVRTLRNKPPQVGLPD